MEALVRLVAAMVAAVCIVLVMFFVFGTMIAIGFGLLVMFVIGLLAAGVAALIEDAEDRRIRRQLKKALLHPNPPRL